MFIFVLYARYDSEVPMVIALVVVNINDSARLDVQGFLRWVIIVYLKITVWIDVLRIVLRIRFPLLHHNASLRLNMLADIAEGERRSIFRWVNSQTTGTKKHRWFLGTKKDFEIFIFDQSSVQYVHYRSCWSAILWQNSKHKIVIQSDSIRYRWHRLTECSSSRLGISECEQL